jgi:hypothetical protein
MAKKWNDNFEQMPDSGNVLVLMKSDNPDAEQPYFSVIGHIGKKYQTLLLASEDSAYAIPVAWSAIPQPEDFVPKVMEASDG